MKTQKDVKAPDGIIEYGERLVRREGRIKFAAIWWQDEKLLPYVGHFLGVRATGYWITEIEIWIPGYPVGKYAFTVKL